jgi:hypothetical protein
MDNHNHNSHHTKCKLTNVQPHTKKHVSVLLDTHTQTTPQCRPHTPTTQTQSVDMTSGWTGNRKEILPPTYATSPHKAVAFSRVYVLGTVEAPSRLENA